MDCEDRIRYERIIRKMKVADISTNVQKVGLRGTKRRICG